MPARRKPAGLTSSWNWCAASRSPSTATRTISTRASGSELFIQVCHAIQHAHQKGIIHRDIKPSNILVTLHDGVPVPKVIDFGIAKATEGRLTDKTLFTAYEQFIGTPAYMSPEQAEMSGLDVDTRSDIYSLGVLLYELLTGRTPFDPKELAAIRPGRDAPDACAKRNRSGLRPIDHDASDGGTDGRPPSVATSEPPKLISLLRGDLDWIVMKALEKDRTRRYETANGLAMDIQRYLNNEPVMARPPSRLYRFQKLVRRNKIVFAAGGAVAAALIIGLGVSTWLFFLEKAARQRAVAAEQQAEQERAKEAELRRLAETREKITQATVLLNEEKFDDADRLMSQVSINQPTVEGAAAFRSLGEYYAMQNQWKAAADRFNVLLQINQLDGWDVCTLDYLEYGPALIEQGDVEGYERFRQAAVARFTGGPHPFADRIVKISLLLPADLKLLKALQPLADVTAHSLATNADANADIFWPPGVRFPWRWWNIAAAITPGRRTGASNVWIIPKHIAPRTATARVILAMSDQQLGKTDEARSQLAQAREIIDNKFKSQLDRGTPMQGFWFDWVFARILLNEATAMIEGNPQTTQLR